MRRHGTDKEVYVTEPGNVKSLGIRQRSLPLVSRSNVPVAMVVPLAGHVHAGSATGFAGTVATSCSSTWRQLYVASEDPPTLSTAPPGMALHIVEGMSAVTHVRPIGECPLRS